MNSQTVTSEVAKRLGSMSVDAIFTPAVEVCKKYPKFGGVGNVVKTGAEAATVATALLSAGAQLYSAIRKDPNEQ